MKCCTMHHTFEFAFVVAAHSRRGSSDVLPTLHAARPCGLGQCSLLSLYKALWHTHDAISAGSEGAGCKGPGGAATKGRGGTGKPFANPASAQDQHVSQAPKHCLCILCITMQLSLCRAKRNLSCCVSQLLPTALQAKQAADAVKQTAQNAGDGVAAAAELVRTSTTGCMCLLPVDSLHRHGQSSLCTVGHPSG